MKRFSFVVLHYQNLNDTVECIEALLKLHYEDYHIIVVDNGSPNRSGEELGKVFDKQKNVHLISSSINLGFAKGNNLGYIYAKNELHSDFIFLLNNDTIIDQPDFISLIVSKYEKEKFHILGPDIITLDGRHQNPSVPTLQNYSILKKQIRHHKMLLILARLGIDLLLEKWKKKFIKKPFVSSPETPNLAKDKEQFGVKLHGSALCFSTDYIEKYDGLYSKTFMYSEEAILYYVCKRDNLVTLYFPEAKVLHKEDGATDVAFKKARAKRIFYYENFIDSGKELLNLMKKDSTNEC